MSDSTAGASGSTAQTTARWALIIALALLGGWVLRHFLPALCWAVVLAIATSSLYERWLGRFRGKRRDVWAALTFTTLVGIVLIVPLVYGGVVAVREAITLAHTYADSLHGKPPVLPDWITQIPWLRDWILDFWNERIGHTAAGTAGAVHSHVLVPEWTRVLGLQVARRISTLAFTLLTLFFVYLNRAHLSASVRRAAQRVFGPPVDTLLTRMVGAVRATVDGVVLVAVAEGAIMAVVYAVAGAPHPILFGAVTGVFAMIPFAAPIAFGMVAILLASQGAVVGAIVVAGIGLIVLFIADHFVRPVIIGEGARLPFLWVLLGILGGVETFGLVGIFLGPALMAALVSIWRNWSADTTPTDVTGS
ncbi:MAG TPA: AI-2E family transporter [Steroidobacteraceae bacterium]|nr:AI-2E family transporter [Steroidobacteraceae bacterium]